MKKNIKKNVKKIFQKGFTNPKLCVIINNVEFRRLFYLHTERITHYGNWSYFFIMHYMLNCFI